MPAKGGGTITSKNKLTSRDQLLEDNQYSLGEIPSRLYGEETGYNPEFIDYSHTSYVQMIRKHENIAIDRPLHRSKLVNPDVCKEDNCDTEITNYDPRNMLGANLDDDLEENQKVQENFCDKAEATDDNVPAIVKKLQQEQNRQEKKTISDNMMNILVIIVLLVGGMFVYTAIASYVTLVDDREKLQLADSV